MNRSQLILSFVLTGIAYGCGTAQPWTALASRFGKTRAQADSLALEKDTVSPEFRAAKKKLNDAEGTMLAFARWKEDMGHYAEAKRRYREILTDNSDCLPARLGIARIEYETGRFDQTREILLEAREQYPNSALVRLELGRVHGDREEWGEAIRFLNEAMDLAPDDQTVRYELGIALARATRYDESMPHLKYAVGESAALYNIGFILQEQCRGDEAAEWIENALQAHPDERTEQLAKELLAELKPARPNSETAVASVERVPLRRQAAWERAPQSVPQVQPRIQAGAATAVRPANPVQSASLSRTVSTPRKSWGQATYRADAASPQDDLPQWNGSERRQIPVHEAGFSPVPAEPPDWRP